MCGKEVSKMKESMHRNTYILLFLLIFISTVTTTKAQKMNDELKKQLRQSLLNPKINHSEQMHQTFRIETQKDQEVLKVSPTTRLPTRLDRFIDINNYQGEKVNLNLKKTNSAPIITRPSGMDFDPVRAIQRHKARKRQKKVDRIVKAYSME